MTIDPDERRYSEAARRAPLPAVDFDAMADRAVRQGGALRRRRRILSATALSALLVALVAGVAATSSWRSENLVAATSTVSATSSASGSGSPTGSASPTDSSSPTDPSSPTDSVTPSNSTTSSDSASPTDSASTSSSTTTSVTASVLPSADTTGWYAVLDDHGWVAPVQDAVTNEIADYQQVAGTGTATLNWRTDHGTLPKYPETPTMGGKVGTTTMLGAGATVFGYGDGYLVVSTMQQDRYVTLATFGISLDETKALAGKVVRP